jgi:CxxC-x17-CxxC domain-containing protein
MFEAICSTCGKTATVPFKPRGDKPVYCRDCFKPQQSYR